MEIVGEAFLVNPGIYNLKKVLNRSQLKQGFFRCLDQKQCEPLFSNARAK